MDDEDVEEDEEYSSETCVDEVVDVLQGPGLPPGYHWLPFSVRLPANLPSSFKGQHGGVSYYVKAIMEKEGEMDLQVKEEIMITGMLDLNLEPTAREAGRSSRQKNLGCFCWRPGTIMASLHTDRTGYISGETIRFTAEVENLSSSDMDSVLLSLVEEVTFMTSDGERRDEREVERLSWSERILARSGDDWEGSLTLPVLPPTGLAGPCSIIDLQYRLDLQLNPSRLVVSLPIILGTRALQDSRPPLDRDDLKPSCPTLPPSYTESLLLPTISSVGQINSQWVPRYFA